MREKEDKQEMVYGIRPLMEALDAGKEVEKVFIQKGLGGNTFRELMPLLKERQIPYQVVPVEKLNRLTRKNHQGVVAYISPITFYDIEQLLPTIYESGETPFILILDKISDVRNFGAILRTAESAGVQAVLIPSKGAAQLNSGTIKSSAGAIFKVPICRTHNLKTAITFLKNSGLRIAAVTEKAEKVHFETTLTGPLALIMGSEGEGISPEYLKLADVKIRIPMLGQIASLNVSAATAVILYEVVRQRLQEKE
ncbi:23S rRNA (guanosine(2251)-2'-O)-methyltransferase RlmB [Candidatus Sulfidibacterium hydrothermale]|uniref:23S rRNA (guanosine(2251)-2'-O)-methyltransferase RlmB n=1 Tax=Candidatus Sulfidibacterium hydrothermale TaxID=2875962 RepID=UPI001F0A7261|nr:23S rRNA (guanosine(2251)-2'-O)-methyltransferase RlmB [Candidatus Sulfidibacterium hydrothermale]UBM63485.1 23S rRNA (guanosine(2251)-2'-O)-methyltransferase RlmB [Candidatus Sulfidibacterium hydrothermale]